jgi:hypothetical protein
VRYTTGPPRPACPRQFSWLRPDIRGRINERRILSAKFEEDGGQVLCGCFHDDRAHLDAPGEEDEVKRKLEEFRNFFPASRNGSYASRVEILRNEIQQDFVCSWQSLREFKNARVARRKNVNRRVEKQRQRAVERAYYQRDAIRLSIDLGSMSALSESLRKNYILRFHPLL